MNKKIFLFLSLVLFLSFSHIAHAEVVITKVIYDSPPDGSGDWIEIHNTGSSSITIKGKDDINPWKITTTNSPNSTKYNFSNDFIIEPNEYVALVYDIDRFNEKQNYSGKIIKTTIKGLNDNSGYISILKNDNGSFSSIAFYQYPSSASSSNNNEEENDTTSSSNTTTPSSNSKEEVKIIPTFKANILAPNLAFVGQPVLYNLEVKYGSDIYAVGKYFWNFGDGTSYEKIDGFEKFTHIYYYPGEYVVSLDYFKNKNSVEPDVRDEMIVKVIPLTISISKVGDQKDFFIELTNNADYKIDISGWYLSSNNKYFNFPKNTIILPKKSMILSPKITNFAKIDEANLKLYSSINELVFDYNPIVKKSIINNTKVSKNNYVPANNISLMSGSKLEQNSDADYILSPDLSINEVAKASSINGIDSFKNINGNSLYFWIFVSLIIVSIFMVLFLRKNREEEKIIGDDFEILDE